MQPRAKRMQEVGIKMQKEGLRMTFGFLMLIVFVVVIFSLI